MPDAETTSHAESPRLGATAIADALATLTEWNVEGDAIVSTYECADFPAAIAFVVRVAFLAEAADHHPDLDIRWRKVRVLLTTHSEGGVTARDIELAKAIESLRAR